MKYDTRAQYVPEDQFKTEPYDDCYGVYKFARRIRNLGYVRLSKFYPYVKGAGNEVMRHRWVYQNEFGDIPPDSVVHHKNGVKGDDRPENLECMTKSQHHKLHRQQSIKRFYYPDRYK